MNAEDNAPSPKSLLNRFGIVNPSTKAELQELTPSTAKKTTSLTKPVARDIIVVALTEATFFKSLLTFILYMNLKNLVIKLKHIITKAFK